MAGSAALYSAIRRTVTDAFGTVQGQLWRSKKKDVAIPDQIRIMTGGARGSILAQTFHLTSAERKTLLVRNFISSG